MWKRFYLPELCFEKVNFGELASSETESNLFNEEAFEVLFFKFYPTE